MTDTAATSFDIPVVDDLAGLKEYLTADPTRERVAVYYTASWCPTCKAHLPVVKKLAEPHRRVTPLLIVNMDKDVMDGEMESAMNIFKLPTLHLIVRGEIRGCVTQDNVLKAEKYIFATECE